MKVTATLVSIFGPLKGSTFSLTEAEIYIGRDISNSISLIDPLLSRKHCKIYKEADDFKIVDLNSRNGIFVNDIPTSGAILHHCDEIELGDSVFLFLLTDVLEPSRRIQLNEELITASTTQLKAEDALYLKPDHLPKARQGTERVFHDLGVLLKISSVINSILDFEILQKKLLQLTFDVIPAERGAIILSTENPEDVCVVYAAEINSNQIPKVQISKSIVMQVMNERTAVHCNDVTTPQKSEYSKSSMAPNAHSALCVPLIAFDKLLGVLYFDTEKQNHSFDEYHLQLAWGIASIAAIAIKNALEIKHLIEENTRLQAGTELNMVGESEAIVKIHQLVAKAAPSNSTVLICGESGTGKEMVARAIHRNSPRAGMPFVAINCASLTETLLESELFGHERGAFTGAIALKKGKLEIADRGTVFLDEVSEIPTTVQAKLLRFLQEREFERLGGTRKIKIDVRFVAATNRNLEQAIRIGTFRQDLFYRLNVIRVEVPPLRERTEDISLLAKYFVSHYSKTLQRRVKGISSEALECLLEHDWPGNVRELENLIERAVVLGSTELIVPEDFPEELVQSAPKITTGFMQSVKEKKKNLVLKALQQAGGSYPETAKILGVHPNYLYRLLRSLGLNKDSSGS
jgi:transcriptional regulator with GAF, ATPase, and Fis domain